MVKKKGFIIIVFFVLIFSGLNLFLFLNKGDTSYSSMTGRFISEIPSLPKGLTLSTVAFVAQWLILLVIVLFAYSKFIRHKKTEHLQLNYNQIEQRRSKSGTDLDTLYALLQERKKASIPAIAKVFKISNEKALDWGKILENKELVTVEYPAFSDPEVRMKTKEDEEESDKTKEKKGGKKKEKAEDKAKEDKAKGKAKQDQNKTKENPTKEKKVVSKKDKNKEQKGFAKK